MMANNFKNFICWILGQIHHNDDEKTVDLFFCSKSQYYVDQENISFQFMLLYSPYYDGQKF